MDWRGRKAARRLFRVLSVGAQVTTVLISDGVRSALAHTPHDDIFDIAISPDYARDRTLYTISRGFAFKSVDGGATWARIVNGLDNRGGFSSVHASPVDGKRLFLASPGDGIYKSTDAGSSWSKANEGLATLDVAFVVGSPHSLDVAFAAGLESGLFSTSDGGATWHPVPGLDGHVTALEFCRARKGSIFAGTADGFLYASQDGGETGNRVRIRGAGAVRSIAVSPDFAASRTLFVATHEGGVFASTDGGATFWPRNEGLGTDAAASLVLSPSYPTDATLWASTDDDGVFVSHDAGDSWEPSSAGLTTDKQADKEQFSDRSHFGTLRIAGDAPGTLFVAGFDGLFTSIDAGESWTPLETLSSSIIVGLAVSPSYPADSTLAVTTYINGAFISKDGGATWSAINEGLEEPHRYDVAADHVARLFGIAFSPDYPADGAIFTTSWRYFMRSPAEGRGWDAVVPGGPSGSRPPRDKFVVAASPDFAEDDTLFLGARSGDLFASSDAGATFSRLADLDVAISYLVVSPAFAADTTLFAGTGRGTYKSVDAGRTWTRVGGTSAVTAIAISPDYGVDGTLFVGTRGGLYITADGGESWTSDRAPLFGSRAVVEAVALAPSYMDEGMALVSIRGRGLFRTVDRGATFVAVADELIEDNHLIANFSLPTSSPIVFSPGFARDRTVYAFAFTKLFRSTDGGDSWEPAAVPRSIHHVIPRSEPTSRRPVGSGGEGGLSRRRIAYAAVVLAIVGGPFSLLLYRRRARQSAATTCGSSSRTARRREAARAPDGSLGAK